MVGAADSVLISEVPLMQSVLYREVPLYRHWALLLEAPWIFFSKSRSGWRSVNQIGSFHYRSPPQLLRWGLSYTYLKKASWRKRPVFVTDLLCAMGFAEEICPARLYHSYMKHHWRRQQSAAKMFWWTKPLWLVNSARYTNSGIYWRTVVVQCLLGTCKIL